MSKPQRRTAEARREISDRVVLHVGGTELDGWALNISAGGLRAIIDTEGVNLAEIFSLGRDMMVKIGEADDRPARLVWIRSEPDGAVLGVAFLDQTAERPPSVPPGTDPAMVRSPMKSELDIDIELLNPDRKD
jgi:PilZ domain